MKRPRSYIFAALIALFFGALAAINLVHPKTLLAQDTPTCYAVVSSGEVIDLTELCGSDAESRQISNQEAIQKISEQALDHMQTGRFEEAGNSLTKVIELMDAEHADLPEVYYERGTMFIGTEDFRSAIADFQSAARIYRSRGEQADAEYMEELAEIYTSY